MGDGPGSNSSSRSSTERLKSEAHDVDKFIRCFCVKSIQIICMTRTCGLKPFYTESDPCSHHWFNLKVPECPQTLASVKEAMDREFPLLKTPLVVQISLAAPCRRVIEAWQISRTSECDSTVKIVSGVYNKLSLLLKSLLTVLRCTPAYKLAREGRAALKSEFFFGNICPSMLNEECEKRRLGYVKTPFGSLTVSVFYKSFNQIDLAIARDSFSNLNSSGVQVDATSQSKQPQRPHDPDGQVKIKAAFAAKPEVCTDILPELPLHQLIKSCSQNTNLFSQEKLEDPKLCESDTTTSSKHSTHLSCSSAEDRSYVLIGCREPAFASSTAETSPRGDVQQFYRVVQRAKCLRAPQATEGVVITHDIHLTDYITSFQDTSTELAKLSHTL